MGLAHPDDSRGYSDRMRMSMPGAALALAAALALGGCSGDSGQEAPTSTPSAEQTPEETSAPADDVQVTTGPVDDNGGAEGQAAAALAKQWITALATGDPSACDVMADSTGSAPLAESAAEYDICVANIPQIAQAQFNDELVAIIEIMEISGAEVTGDRAVIDVRHFSEVFASAFATSSIVLISFDGAWYVDMSSSSF